MIWIYKILLLIFALQDQSTDVLFYKPFSNTSRRMDESSISFLLHCSWSCSDRDIYHSKLFTMQGQKGKKNQPDPFQVVQSNVQKLLKSEIDQFFSDMGYEAVQDELMMIQRDLVSKEIVKSCGIKYIRERQYCLSRVVTLLTKMRLLTQSTELYGNN